MIDGAANGPNATETLSKGRTMLQDQRDVNTGQRAQNYTGCERSETLCEEHTAKQDADGTGSRANSATRNG